MSQSHLEERGAGGFNTEPLDSSVDSVQASRRQMLALGLAGMPMVLTMRASASEALVSQFRCKLNVPAGLAILVHTDGRVWLANVNWHSGNDLTCDRVNQIMREAQFAFPAGTAPTRYRPSGCGGTTTDTCEADAPQSEDGLGGGESESPPSAGGNSGNGKGKGGSSDTGNFGASQESDCPEEDCNLCDYSLIFNRTQSAFPVGRVISPNGHVSTGDTQGLYTYLAIRHAEQNGGRGNFPGVSCIASVMDYIRGRP